MFYTLRVVVGESSYLTSESSALKKDPTHLALNHFDKHYEAQFGPGWPSIRLGLFSLHKYGALINNSCHKDEATERFLQLGAKDFVQLAARHLRNAPSTALFKDADSNVEECNKGEYVDSYEAKDKPPQSTDIQGQRSQEDSWKEEYIVAAGYESKLEYMIGQHQDTAPLLDDVPIETVHIPINISPALRCFTFSSGNFQRFPSSGSDPASGLLYYYLMDASSLLPVMALDIKPQDSVLDMCAAPGGKSLAILGILEKGGIVLNEPSTGRRKRLTSVLRSYLPQEIYDSGRVQVTSVEGQEWGLSAPDTFDKILVDVPCTTDRLSLKEKENNIFKPRRSKERWELPSLQEDLLCSALRSVKPGGDVVYSTCSLSSLQNDGVVQGAISKCKEAYNMTIQVVDLSPLASSTESVFTYSNTTKYGQLIIPDLTKNFGPLFFAKLHKT